MLLWFCEEFLFSDSHLFLCIFACSLSMPTCLYVTYLALPCSVSTEVAAATGYSCQNPLTAHSVSSLQWAETDGHFWQPLSQQLQELLLYFCVYVRSWLLTATESLLSLRADGSFHTTCLELMCRGYTTGLVEASALASLHGLRVRERSGFHLFHQVFVWRSTERLESWGCVYFGKRCVFCQWEGIHLEMC